jgi:type VI secretion system secreted protein Hcp
MVMAVDMFLKLDGIKGESGDHKHKDEIHIESFSFGMSQLGGHSTGGGGGTGKVSVQDVHVTKFTDKSSAALALHCATGKHIPSGLITVRKAGDKPLEYLKIKLTDILVSGISWSGHGSGEKVAENVSLNMSKIQIEYQEQKADGSGAPAGEMGFDIKANTKI